MTREHRAVQCRAQTHSLELSVELYVIAGGCIWEMVTPVSVGRCEGPPWSFSGYLLTPSRWSLTSSQWKATPTEEGQEMCVKKLFETRNMLDLLFSRSSLDLQAQFYGYAVCWCSVFHVCPQWIDSALYFLLWVVQALYFPHCSQLQ